jgi:hypothetical protein
MVEAGDQGTAQIIAERLAQVVQTELALGPAATPSELVP